ncbi:polyprenyl synthetase family protein [Helicobacter sp.]|uniref:polyprenyl synthetase family protein n=1 Tax=Helicobacter sp. TaxID=218 RepID=UPI0025C227FC|nr:polyprenyl synthetase family protein [Helicobacter sp.]MCI5968100.1 polyprenyl synthetase family protein [Helicobacter sp.]MDY2584108.1 polyprenyl synthetase family protein [Helicobacter sp.]
MKTIDLVFEDFEAYLKENAPKIPSFHPNYENALWEMVLNGGKRFRPKLLLSIVASYKKENVSLAFAPALALEILHTYSLIHDDLPAMDNAPLRRGCETLHKKYDEVLAILAGDGLNTQAFYLIATSKLKPKIKVKLIESLSYNGGIYGMVLGQALDCHFEGQKLPLEQLRIIHLNKTAKLIAASLEMGAMVAECDKKMCKSLYQLGLDLGLFFQICDDVIDSTQSTQEAGKPTHNDGVKNSYVNLLGLEGARRSAKLLQDSLLRQIETLNKPAKKHLKALLGSYFDI